VVVTRLSEEQIQRIYRDTIDPLYGYVSRLCNGDRALAEDVTQETWLRAVADWRRKGAPDNALAWLSTVARNLLLNHMRRPPMVPLDAIDPPAAADDSSRGAITRLVTTALTRLPKRESRLLESFHFDGVRVAQIAQENGISERAVEGRLRRARAHLRRQLQDIFKGQEERND
jgi:RNA polymerase sigma-70 factor (ECF subfamily)